MSEYDIDPPKSDKEKAWIIVAIITSPLWVALLCLIPPLIALIWQHLLFIIFALICLFGFFSTDY